MVFLFLMNNPLEWSLDHCGLQEHRLSWEGILVQKTGVINRQQPEAFS